MSMDWIPAPLAPRDGADWEFVGYCQSTTVARPRDGACLEAVVAHEVLGWRTAVRDNAGEIRTR
jgi:hypothetical protein